MAVTEKQIEQHNGNNMDDDGKSGFHAMGRSKFPAMPKMSINLKLMRIRIYTIPMEQRQKNLVAMKRKPINATICLFALIIVTVIFEL